jgi:hypothetical protein
MTDHDEQPPDEPLSSGEFMYQRAQRIKREREERERAQASQGSPLPPPQTASVSDISEKRRSAWVDWMLDRAVERLSAASEGSRNDELNTVAFTLGGIVHLGLDDVRARQALYDCALSIGLTKRESKRTIQSGFSAGGSKPLHPMLAERALLNGSVEWDVDALVGFWSARPILQHIFDYAKSRRTSPWAVLGVELARVIARVPPTLMLPPFVGGYGSLNIFVALVGLSGAGKGGAERAAQDAIGMEHVATASVGSGEGLVHSYVKRDRKGEQQSITEHMLFSVPEIDTLTAVGQRTGATLLPELRRAWSGEALGFAYADPTKRLRVETYRLALILGVQPGRAKALLDDADGGTPQRFIWLPANDRDAPEVAPSTPDPEWWDCPNVLAARREGMYSVPMMGVCDLAAKTIDDAALARLRGETEALDGHLLYAQLKTAAALALLDKRLDISEEDWLLADVVMRVSTRTREHVTAALQSSSKQRNLTQAERFAERTFIVADKAAERDADHEQRVVQRIVTLLQGGSVMTRAELHRGVRHNYRHAFDVAFDGLLSDGVLMSIDDEKGVTRYAFKG